MVLVSLRVKLRPSPLRTRWSFISAMKEATDCPCFDILMVSLATFFSLGLVTHIPVLSVFMSSLPSSALRSVFEAVYIGSIGQGISPYL